MTDQKSRDFLNEPFEAMIEAEFDNLVREGKLTQEEIGRWHYEASIQGASRQEFLYEYISNRPNLKEEDLNRLHTFIENDQYLQEGVDASEPNAVFVGTVNEILYSDNGLFAFTYMPDGKELPLGILRSPQSSNFSQLYKELSIGSRIEVKLDERGEIGSVNLLNQSSE